MTIQELIDELDAIEAEHGNIEIRLAQQPRWAFEYSIDRDTPVAVAKVGGKYGEKKEMVAYIAEGRQLNYLPGAAAVALGWSEDHDDDDEDDDENEEAR